MVRTDGRTDRRTDGRTDGQTDTEGYNIIPRHTLVAGYKNGRGQKKFYRSIANNESADKTMQMHRLVRAFVVHIQQSQAFL